MRSLYLVLLCAASCLGQKISFGVVGGTAITKDFRTLIYSSTFEGQTYIDRSESGARSPILGPMVELGLPRGFGLEVNALRRKLHYTGTTSVDTVLAPFRASVTTWEFPMLLKYRIPMPLVQPFLAVGPSFRAHHNPSGSRPSMVGATGGVGAELNLGRGFRIAPTLRYTRWDADQDAPFRPTLRNQVEFLVGLSYATGAGQRSINGRKIWLGLIAGVPLTNDFPPIAPNSPPYTGENRRRLDFRFAAGLLAEFSLPRNFSLEVNGLYRRLHFEKRPEVVLTWEIPVLAKYRFSQRRAKPFIEAGPSFRLAGNLNNTNPSHFGMTAGAGVEAHAGRWRFTPTLRYTRWMADGPSDVFTRPVTKVDQVELLVGFSF